MLLEDRSSSRLLKFCVMIDLKSVVKIIKLLGSEIKEMRVLGGAPKALHAFRVLRTREFSKSSSKSYQIMS